MDYAKLHFTQRDLLFIEYNYNHYKNELNDPTIRFFIIQKISETTKASEKLVKRGYYDHYRDNLVFRKYEKEWAKHIFKQPRIGEIGDLYG